MRVSIRAIALACTALALTGVASADAAQDRKAAYAALAELPDWDGVWYPDWAQRTAANPPAPPQFTAKGTKAMADYNAGKAKGENLQTDDANCIPPGMPRVMGMPYPIEILLTPGRVTIMTEAYEQVRRIHTDGRKVPDDPDPSFNGYSTGKWVNGALEVDTIAVNPRVTVVPGIHPSENMRIHERFWLEAPDKMVVETTITDPEIFAQPYVSRRNFARKAHWEIREYVCQENNKDASDPFGRPSMDIN